MLVNKEIRLFEQDLIKHINSSVLPIEVKRLVLAEVLEQTKEEAQRIVLTEMESENNGLREDGLE